MVTAEEFEAQFAERSGMTVERLRATGVYPVECHCGWNRCQGWQMVHPNDSPAPPPPTGVWRQASRH